MKDVVIIGVGVSVNVTANNATGLRTKILKNKTL
jgi:hypothetical protein